MEVLRITNENPNRSAIVLNFRLPNGVAMEIIQSGTFNELEVRLIDIDSLRCVTDNFFSESGRKNDAHDFTPVDISEIVTLIAEVSEWKPYSIKAFFSGNEGSENEEV